MISINNGAILVKTGTYDGLMQIGMLDWFSGRGSRLVLLIGMLDRFSGRGDRLVLVIGMLCW